jgi:hypothetical protein
LND